ncbi:cupin domain-containing protein [Spiractinospora alimapuensis]|uniref:cupin domain-containing protein n=1 Tax=Spiractinospora alimapuensis TaxID=2820884 RepID=UPI001F32EEB9|nr:cupin domain-containing protein [Spiractinospora alimapuensis]QVQ52755.1 cupin domain-containing protein [Spiractinospora alimapuensis]
MTDTARIPRAFTSADPETWMEVGGGAASIGLVVDASHGSTLGVGFARLQPGELDERDSPIPYDEVFVVLSGRLTVRVGDTSASAGPGEVIFLPRGTAAIYAATEPTEYVATSHPPYGSA